MINNEESKNCHMAGDTAPVDNESTHVKESSTGDRASSTSGAKVARQSYQPTGETPNHRGMQPNIPGSDLVNIEERETPQQVENLDHSKNFQKAPSGEHSSHLPEGAGGLIT